MKKEGISRRNFLTGTAALGATGIVGPGIVTSCGTLKSQEAIFAYKKRELNLPPLLDSAPDGSELKAGLVGCGGRGTGAAINFLDAGPNLKITALGDVFEDRIDSCKEKIKTQKGVEIPDENCFIGFDAYEKVINSGVDVVLLATPPVFRPAHFEAAVKAGKHVFLEKPVAVDPVGVRSIMSTAKMAESMNLKVVSGTHKRHETAFVELLKRVNDNMVGNLISANIYFNMQRLWFRNRDASWTDMEWMIRDWVNWCWLSGDHIVEQHVHNIDIANWFFGTHPVKAMGLGSRQRRPTGDQYDNFGVDFTLNDGRQIHSICRQINGTDNLVTEIFHGTKGIATTNDWKSPKIIDVSGKEIETIPEDKKGGHAREQVDLVTCIRKDIAINEAEQTAISTMVAIMGRVSAYTGKTVTYEEMMNSDLKLGPGVFVMNNNELVKKTAIPIPGKED